MAYDELRKPNEWEWRVKGEQAICKKKQPIQIHPRKLTWQWKTTSVMLVSGRVHFQEYELQYHHVGTSSCWRFSGLNHINLVSCASSSGPGRPVGQSDPHIFSILQGLGSKFLRHFGSANHGGFVIYCQQKDRQVFIPQNFSTHIIPWIEAMLQGGGIWKLYDICFN